MNKDLKEKWIAALRSGNYKQGSRRLKRKVNDQMLFCCLGVLCEVAGLESIMQDDRDSFTGINHNCYYYVNDGISATVVLPGNVGNVSGTDEGVLVRMNDTGKTFDEIADYISEKM